MPALGLWLREQLEQVQAEVVTQDFPERIIINGDWIPVSTELNPGAETYSYKIMTAVGEAAILANGGDDIPLVSAFCEKRIGIIRTVADGYEYTIEDIESAQFTNMNLDATMGQIARDVIETKLDQLGFDGDSAFGLLGILNHPNVPSGTVSADGNSNGGTNSTRWIHKTAVQIFRDLTGLSRAPRTATNGIEWFDTFAIPQNEYDLIAETPYPENSASNETILSFFTKTQGANPKGVRRIIAAPYLAGKGTGGTGLMIGTRKLPQKIKYHLVKDFTQQSAQYFNFNVRIPCRARTGGIQVTRPMSMGSRSGL